jgi:hypothetical protein
MWTLINIKRNIPPESDAFKQLEIDKVYLDSRKEERYQCKTKNYCQNKIA